VIGLYVDDPGPTPLRDDLELSNEGGGDASPASALGDGEIVDVDLAPLLLELLEHVRGQAADDDAAFEGDERDGVCGPEPASDVGVRRRPREIRLTVVEGLCEHALKLVPDGPVTDALNGLAGLYGRTFTDRALAEQTNVRGALEAISEAGAESFNAKYPNDPRVHYYSFAGVSAKLGVGDSQDMTACEGMLDGDTDQMSPLLVPLALIVGHGFGFQKGFRPNDGMTTVESSKWGEFLGCIRADHLDEVGQIQHDGPDPRTGFDHIAFFRALVSTMGEHGY